MARTNIVTAAFVEGRRDTKTSPIWQYDYGQILDVAGITLPGTWEAHFSNAPKIGTTTVSIGTGTQVAIPDMYLVTGLPVYCWIFLHTGEDDGETVYSITIPVNQRPLPTDEEPTPEEQSVITQTIAALNAAAETAEAQAEAAGQSATSAADSAAAAESYARSAEESAEQAAGAVEAADRAEQAAANAEASAESAAGSATDADTAADRAEQAATTAGYMFFQIDAIGHLIYERTAQVTAEFSINPSGHLILGGA